MLRKNVVNPDYLIWKMGTHTGREEKIWVWKKCFISKRITQM